MRSGARWKDKTMLIGVGPTKTGTGWLFEFLRKHPEFCPSPIKELQYFNARFGQTDKDRDQIKLDQLKRLVEKIGPKYSLRGLDRVQALVERLKMPLDPSAYIRLFKSRATRDQVAFGEISPGYFEMAETGFAALKATHSKTKIIVQLRDPVDRTHASMRHEIKHGEHFGFKDYLFGRFLDELPSSSFRYDLCLERIYSIFDQDDVLVLFFETLFTDESIKLLTDFAGLSYRDANFDFRSGHSPHVEPYTEEMRAHVRRVLDPVYSYCRERYGERVPCTWAT